MKKLISVFLALMIAAANLPLFSVPVSALYTDSLNLEKAMSYAKTWAESRNLNEYEDNSRNDCANFVFQILVSGGIPETQYFHGSKAYGQGTTMSSKNVPSLVQYFRSMYGIKYYNRTGKLSVGTISEEEYKNGSKRQKSEPDITHYDGQTTYACDGQSFTINDIKPGDCVTINTADSNNGRGHIVFVLSVNYSGNSMQITGHTSDRYDYTYNFSIVQGVLKTSDLIRSSGSVSSDSSFLYGDVNGNGECTITDLTLVNRVVNGKEDISILKSVRAADVDLDNAITNTDLQLINKRVVNLVKELPVVGDYKCYTITPVLNESIAMDVERGDNNNGTNIGAFGKHGEKNQVFMVVPVYSIYSGTRKFYNRIIPLSDNTYTKCLSVDTSNNNLQLNTFDGFTYDLWSLEPITPTLSEKKYIIKSAYGGALAIEGDYDGANIYLAKENKFDDKQKWVFTEVTVDLGQDSSVANDNTIGSTSEFEVKGPTTSDQLSFSENGVKRLCEFEGFHQYCYQDAEQSSIGYGTKCTGSSQQPHAAGSHSITKEDALAAMRVQVEATYAPRVRKQTAGLLMNQYQFDALVSLCYNTGGGTKIISESPLVRYLRGELMQEEARAQYAQYYVKSNGKKLDGLVNRRKKEADLFFTEAGNVSATVGSSTNNSYKSDMELVSNHLLYNSYISYYNPNNTKEVVMALQRLLNAYGNYQLEVDGICGKATRNAIRSFQQDNGLTVDGLFGKDSKNKLKEKLGL